MGSHAVQTILPISRCIRDLFFENTSTREHFCPACILSTDYPLANQHVERHRVVFYTAAEVLRRLRYRSHLHSSSTGMHHVLWDRGRFAAFTLSCRDRQNNRKFCIEAYYIDILKLVYVYWSLLYVYQIVTSIHIAIHSCDSRKWDCLFWLVLS